MRKRANDNQLVRNNVMAARHYWQIADCIAQTPNARSRKSMAVKFAKYLGEHNSNFKQSTFLKACGVAVT